MSLIISFYIVFVGLIYISYEKRKDRAGTDRSKAASGKMIRDWKFFLNNYSDDPWKTIEKDISKRITEFRLCSSEISCEERLKIDRYFDVAEKISHDTFESECPIDIDRNLYKYTVIADIIMAIEYKKVPFKRFRSGYTERTIALWVFDRIYDGNLSLYIDTNIHSGRKTAYFYGTDAWMFNKNNIKNGCIKREYISERSDARSIENEENP